MKPEPLVIEDSGIVDGRRTLRLKGPLLVSNLFEFQSLSRSDGSASLVLDFSEVPYVDSAGIGCLVGTYVNHDKAGRSLRLVGVNDRVRAALAVTHVEHFFKFDDSERAEAS